MTQIMGTPKFVAMDNNGDPLSGGKLYSYTAGTDTPLATYPTIADASAETNANSNPVILDSRGEANVVIKGATKLVLKDANGVTLWTFDNIVDSVNNALSSIIDSNGNTILDLPKVGGAVNYVAIGNNVTGQKPTIAAAGGDTNVGLAISSKGTGVVAITGAVTLSSTINGLTLPGTSTTSGFSVISNGSGTLSYAQRISSMVTQVITATGTYTPTSGMMFCEVIVVGGGGGGGNAVLSSTIAATAGSGGGGGSSDRKVYNAAEIGANAAVTIGAGGAAANAGGTTTFDPAGTGATLDVGGGKAGVSTQTVPGLADSALVGPRPLAGDIGSNPGIQYTPGTSGGAAMSFMSSTRPWSANGGDGGSSIAGRGGLAGRVGTAADTAVAGDAGVGYGAGGGGAAALRTTSGNASANGAAGTAGVVIIYEYL